MNDPRLLVAMYSCNCLSSILVLDGDTNAKDVGAFHAEAFRRGCQTVEMPKSLLPPLRCGRAAPECKFPAKKEKKKAGAKP